MKVVAVNGSARAGGRRAPRLSRQSCPQPRVDLLRGLLLHARHHVRVGVCGDLDARV